MKIKVSRFNEVGRDEVERLLKLGARIIHEKMINGTWVTSWKGEAVRAGDTLIFNNVGLPIAYSDDDGYFDSEIEIVANQIEK